MSFRGKCTANNAHSQNGNAWGDVFAFEKKRRNTGVVFLWLTNDFPYLVGKKMSVFDWGAELLQPGVENDTRTLSVLLRWLRVCCCCNELHNEFRQSHQKSINLRSGAPWTISEPEILERRRERFPNRQEQSRNWEGHRLIDWFDLRLSLHKGMTHNI